MSRNANFGTVAQLVSCLALLGTASVGPGAAMAQSTVRILPFAKTGKWTVKALYASSGPFNSCSASAKYRSGTRVAFIAYSTGIWKLQFYKSDWPNRRPSKFPARLSVDGRTVLTGEGKFRGRSAFIRLGRSSKRVIALMRGRTMTITTPAGSSSFRLDGTFSAAVHVAKCWKKHSKRRSYASNQGAFGKGKASGAFGGGTTGGAFGSSGVATGAGVKILSRGETLDLVTTYLSAFKRPYSILPANKNVLKHFPVNWKFQNGLLGGMKVYKNTRTSADRMLRRLLAQQATRCQGRSAIEPEKPILLKGGRKVARARGICEIKGRNLLKLRYRITELNSNTLMVVLYVGAKRIADGATAKRGGGGGAPRKQPGPNEL